jgi:hypothetical protein
MTVMIREVYEAFVLVKSLIILAALFVYREKHKDKETQAGISMREENLQI